VTNLPFKFSDEDFAVVFTDAGTKPKSAKVVRNRNGRSKGYGFVEFENNVDQQKALKAVNTKVVAERELVVKVAMIEPQGEQKAEQPSPSKPRLPLKDRRLLLQLNLLPKLQPKPLLSRPLLLNRRSKPPRPQLLLRPQRKRR
jgi:RNA recognition motif-containing protein